MCGTNDKKTAEKSNLPHPIHRYLLPVYLKNLDFQTMTKISIQNQNIKHTAPDMTITLTLICSEQCLTLVMDPQNKKKVKTVVPYDKWHCLQNWCI